MNIILASASPRRRELLKLIYSDFEIIPADIDETAPKNIQIVEYAKYIANSKAEFISKEYRNSLIIGCDTTVIVEGKCLGKPLDSADAFRMLKSFSDKTHQVITGVSIIYNDALHCFSETTEVTFHNLSDEEIYSYISTNEPFDKAGGYGIQGKGSLLVRKINGDYFNVVGLPVSRLNQELKYLGYLK